MEIPLTAGAEGDLRSVYPYKIRTTQFSDSYNGFSVLDEHNAVVLSESLLRTHVIGLTIVAPRTAVVARTVRLQEVASIFLVARKTVLQLDKCSRKTGSSHLSCLRPIGPAHYMLELGE